MLTYALFIATDPDPVSSSDWAHLDQVFDRARLSSGGTRVDVRATEKAGAVAEDYDVEVATFINGIHLEVRDDGPTTFSFVADQHVIGTAQLSDGQWFLLRAPDALLGDGDPVAVHPAGDGREQAELRLGKVVEDWLS